MRIGSVEGTDMKHVNRTRHIFVLSHSADLVELIRKAADETIIVDSAASEAEGLLKLTEIRPDIIIIGRLDSRESAGCIGNCATAGFLITHRCSSSKPMIRKIRSGYWAKKI